MRLIPSIGRLLVGLSCLVLASCSDNSGQSSSDLSCNVAPADEMGATLGHTGLAVPVSKTTNGVLVCSYASGSNQNAVILRMRETTAEGVEVTRKSFEDLGITTVDIPGLGQKAFSASDSTGALVSNTVVAWDGEFEVQISTTGSSVAAIQTMVATILPRLPE